MSNLGPPIFSIATSRRKRNFKRHRPRGPEPLERDHGSQDPIAVRRALQRCHGCGAGRIEQPVLADADHARLGYRRMCPGSSALRPHGLPGGQHDRRPAGLGLPRPRRPGLGSLLGGLCRARSASALPHRGEPDSAHLLRNDVLAQPGRLREAGYRRGLVVPEQLTAAPQQCVLRHVRSASEPQDGLRRERDRVGALHARGHGLRARGERA